jgi:hypothetical protein
MIRKSFAINKFNRCTLHVYRPKDAPHHSHLLLQWIQVTLQLSIAQKSSTILSCDNFKWICSLIIVGSEFHETRVLKLTDRVQPTQHVSGNNVKLILFL